MTSSKSVFALVFLLATPALAQTSSRAQEGPIREAPPPSPIDGPRPDPNQQVEKEAEAEVPSPPLPPRPVGMTWIGWSLGTGYGWHRGARLEGRSDLEVNSALGPGALGHFGAEFGYQWKDRVSLALQSRHQVIPQEVADPGQAGGAKQWAHSVLVRLNYIYPYERYQFFLGGLAGAGQGFRFRISPQQSQQLGASDTVRAGPGIVGPVAGVIVPFAERMSLVAELRGLVGVPDFGAMADLNLGLQFDISGL